jgi:protein-L-isoaspartate(D-aspartate) O-methyltransferase
VTDHLDIALRTVDRTHFCLDDRGNQLPQTSAPEIIARMLGALDVKPGSRVLEIGTGSGYSTTLLAELVASAGIVVSIDVDPPISERAR